MGYGSNRSGRGWIYAIMLAILLAFAFYGVEQLSFESESLDRPRSRVTAHRASSMLINETIVTESAFLEANESRSSLAEVDWQQYRSRPESTLHASVEPTAMVRLEAPRMIPDMIHDLRVVSGTTQAEPFSSASIVFRTTASSTKVSTADNLESHPIANQSQEVRSAAWPVANSLIRDLDSLRNKAGSQDVQVAQWCSDVSSQLESLSRLTSLSDRGAENRLKLLNKLSVTVVDTYSKTAPQSQIHTHQLCLALALQRRVSVWESVWHCVGDQPNHFVSSKTRTIDLHHVVKTIGEVRALVKKTGDQEGWDRYLSLNEVEQLALSKQISSDHALDTVRTFLSRISWQRINSHQREFLALEPIQRLANELHPLALAPVDYRQIMIDLEMLEQSPTHRCSTTLANAIETLRFADQQNQIILADSINNHYRNANLRVAVSGKLIERFLPQNMITDRPVRDKILGAETRGASQIQTKLGIELIPDPSRWNLALRLIGNVQSNTRSNQGPATFHNVSHASVDASRQIQIDQQGIQIDGHSAQVESHDSLRGFDTSFDSLPLIGDLMRLVVRQQFDQKRGLAQRIVRRKIAEQTDAEFDKQLQHQVKDAEKQIASRLFGPLDRLDLHPLVVDLQTTQERLIARYRVASVDQMASNTPRPRAPSDSLLSLQIHQSAINNAIGQLGLGERDWTLQDLREKISTVLGSAPAPADDAHQDILIRFAAQSPVSVEFADGKMRITLRIAELSDSNRMNIQRFVIETDFVLSSDGLRAEFVKDNLSIDGRLRADERLRLRTIFTKVLNTRPTLPLIGPEWASDPRAKGLAVSQLEIRDGWLAIAVSEENSPHITRLQRHPALTR